MSELPNSPDWNQMRALLATVDAGSLSAAAKRLGLTQPTLGRQVAALEESLGIAIFERLGRRLALTEAGAQLVAHLRAMGEAAERVAMTAAGQSQAIEGVVRITTADIYAGHVLPPLLERIRKEAPAIRVEVLATGSISDLLRREADIAIRHVRPDQDGLIARRCKDTRAYIYGAPALLERMGNPANGEALARGDFVGAMQGNEDFMAQMRARGVPLSEANFRLATQSGMTGWEWVRKGMVLSGMVEAVGQATPEVRIAVPSIDPIVVPVWLVTHRELHTSRRIRLVFDMLAEHFS
ncbi:LysR family transcriptional regulator [Devosia sp. XJ19-1]|uniref:LysR family transcriptional regulator n=1 Tax=Devosia ureilytica TaxID=2952754 RepID=A0A9Q4ARM4_9HYPH|nr:LysR family transcriptional regulator [Devosia ureilytica]MCP8884762.1 LysR family transcriptional regulator [Devosia ureilytica]MCP8888393.1 LysR family transcriptional regulator [Devosia ureilytica]